STVFFFSSRRRHTRFSRDWSSDVCSSDLFHATDRCIPSHEEGNDHVREDYDVPYWQQWQRPWNFYLFSVVIRHHVPASSGVSLRSEERRVGKGCRVGRSRGRSRGK